MEDENSMRASKKPKVNGSKRNETPSDQLPSGTIAPDGLTSSDEINYESSNGISLVNSDSSKLSKVSNPSVTQDDVKDVTLDDQSLDK